MYITETKSKILTIQQGEQNFNIIDGMIVYPRASLRVTPDCPDTVKRTIAWAVDNGHLKCVAHVYDSERMWEILNER
jgi:hypothetical protein